ncbi:MAG: translocation/assembly module TamB [Sphingomonas sp.]|nr:translocation/assembly module TamB [Sphingomonas sp.]
MGALGAALAVLVALALLLDTSLGHRFLTERLAAWRGADGMRYSIGRITGSIYGRARLIDVRIHDPKGLVLVAPRADLNWRPWAWWRNELAIDALDVPLATLFKLPEPRATARKGPILPGFDVTIGRLRIARLVTASRLTGRPRVGRVEARAEIRDRRALVRLDARLAGSDRLWLLLDAAPDRDRFDFRARIAGAADGVLAQLVGQHQPLALRVDGDGRWARWRGRALGTLGGTRRIELALANDAGRYALNGWIDVRGLIRDNAIKYFLPRLAVSGRATLDHRLLDARLRLRSAGLDTQVAGALDLARRQLLDTRIAARLTRVDALNPRWSGQPVTVRAILDGPLERPAFDYRFLAPHMDFGGREGLDDIRLAGRGRITGNGTLIPVSGTARRVTGVDPLIADILLAPRLEGAMRIADRAATGRGLKLETKLLNATIDARFAIGSPDFLAVIAAQVPRLELDGLGLVTGGGRFTVRPAPGGQGEAFAGTAEARVLRLDNEFFQHLAAGLPRLATRFTQGPDKVLRFQDLTITAPDIRLVAQGYRRADSPDVHFEGSGTQARYGPVASLVIDGRLERPTIDVRLPRPADPLGLSEVTAHLDPTAPGYDWRAAGGSTLGAFTGQGALLLPEGGRAVVRIAALDVADMRGSGDLTSLPDGFDGRLSVEGAARGRIDFAPVSGNQRVVAQLAAENARFDETRLRRGRLDVTALLDPEGATIETRAEGQGLRQGQLALGRFSASASLRNGTGTARARLVGARGAAFDLAADADIAPDRYVLRASGQIERRPLKLENAAVLTREGDAWRLAETRLSFAGGTGRVAGRFASDSTSLDATLGDMPMTILDLAVPGLGLSGSASGKLSYAQARGSAPTGRVDLRVRGLSRAGLVLRSQPVEFALAGVLAPDKAALRAVMASQGKTIGRAQALLTQLSGDTLKARLANAPLFAQLRYDGPADTLWRLTGIELFDLSGPVAIGADLGGRVNDPSIRGLLQAKGARIESTRTGTVLTNITGTGRFGGSRLTIDDFAADAGRGGRVTGTGSFDFAAVKGFGMDLRLRTDRAVMINRDDIGATISGPLVIRSDGDGGVISGDVRLDSARYRLGQAVQAAAVPKLNLREINLPGGEVEAEAPLGSWRLDVHARTDEALTVNGLGLTSFWSTDLQLGGLAEAPTLNGRAQIIRGTYEFSGRRFEIRRGVIRFQGESPPDPALDIEADATTTGISATIRVTGPSTRPEILFASNPALPQDELLSRLLFGTSITSLSAPEALQLAAAVAALQNGGTGLNPINSLRRAVGLDRLRILPPDQQVGRTTSVAAGKYITRRLYAEIITDGQGYSATQVEFRVTRWLSILSTISTLGRQSINARVSRDY